MSADLDVAQVLSVMETLLVVASREVAILGLWAISPFDIQYAEAAWIAWEKARLLTCALLSSHKAVKFKW